MKAIMKARDWQRACAFAARAHQHQRRKDGVTPYFSHCARVALIVAHTFGCDDETAITAAFLHDTIEDTNVDGDDIEREFGSLVADCVAALSKNMILREPVRQRDYDRRLSEGDWRARLVNLADSYDNLMDSRDRGPDQVRKARKVCQRVINLAKHDAPLHPETKRAIKIVAAASKSRV
jgi:(p)ppGpp synthase/HD superfamily hydrolase